MNKKLFGYERGDTRIVSECVGLQNKEQSTSASMAERKKKGGRK